MDRTEIKNAIKKILNEELGIAIDESSFTKPLLEIGIDSLSFMTLIVYLEEALSLEIDIEKYLNNDFTQKTLEMLIIVVEGSPNN